MNIEPVTEEDELRALDNFSFDELFEPVPEKPTQHLNILKLLSFFNYHFLKGEFYLHFNNKMFKQTLQNVSDPREVLLSYDIPSKSVTTCFLHDRTLRSPYGAYFQQASLYSFWANCLLSFGDNNKFGNDVHAFIGNNFVTFMCMGGKCVVYFEINELKFYRWFYYDDCAFLLQYEPHCYEPQPVLCFDPKNFRIENVNFLKLQQEIFGEYQFFETPINYNGTTCTKVSETFHMGATKQQVTVTPELVSKALLTFENCVDDDGNILPPVFVYEMRYCDSLPLHIQVANYISTSIALRVVTMLALQQISSLKGLIAVFPTHFIYLKIDAANTELPSSEKGYASVFVHPRQIGTAPVPDMFKPVEEYCYNKHWAISVKDIQFQLQNGNFAFDLATSEPSSFVYFDGEVACFQKFEVVVDETNGVIDFWRRGTNRYWFGKIYFNPKTYEENVPQKKDTHFRFAASGDTHKVLAVMVYNNLVIKSRMTEKTYIIINEKCCHIYNNKEYEVGFLADEVNCNTPGFAFFN